MHINSELFNYYLENLLKGNRSECSKIVNDLLKGEIPIIELYELLFRDSLHKIGELWEYNKISVAIEHMATSITESLINLTYPHMFMQEKNGKKAIITCVSGEFHQIGSRMVADFFEMYGWDSYYLGRNTPQKDLFNMIDDKNPEVLAISISIFFNMHTLIEMVSEIRSKYPDLKIITGGQAFNLGGEKSFKEINNVDIINNIETLKNEVLK